MSTKPTTELDALDKIITKLSDCEKLAGYLTNRASKGVGGAVSKAKKKANAARGKAIKKTAQ